MAKYVRAIQVITLMSDQNYQRKLVEFYLSANEANLVDKTIFKDLSDFRTKMDSIFLGTTVSGCRRRNTAFEGND